jgi:hypothetical protein
MATTLCTFNANNLFVRYRFSQTFPGDMSGKSAVNEPTLGYLPIYDPDMFVAGPRELGRVSRIGGSVWGRGRAVR